MADIEKELLFTATVNPLTSKLMQMFGYYERCTACRCVELGMMHVYEDA